MGKPSMLILDASVYLPRVVDAIRRSMIAADPHDLHSLREGAIETELDYHLDNIVTLLRTKDHAVMRMVEYMHELTKEQSNSMEVVMTLTRLTIHMYDTINALGAYVKDDYFPYQYHSRVKADGIVLMQHRF
jgi:hypothetical protein